MTLESFSDASLVLIGHGSTVNRESAAAVFQHANELRRRGSFADVREGFWKQEPQIKDVLSNLTAPRVFLVPLFISEGYFSERVIPAALGFSSEEQEKTVRVQKHESQILIYTKPIGTHQIMTEVLLTRAREVIETFPFPRAPLPNHITLFIAGHGTQQEENSRTSIEHQAELIRARGIYAAVHAVFLEEDPRVSACYQMAQTKHIVVVPFFISGGMHVQEDIPVLLGEPQRIVQQRLQNGQSTWRNPSEKQGKLMWYAASVGTAAMIVDVILERVRESAATL